MNIWQNSKIFQCETIKFPKCFKTKHKIFYNLIKNTTSDKISCLDSLMVSKTFHIYFGII